MPDTTALSTSESAAAREVPNEPLRVMIDGNEACAHVAYRVNEVCAIYPITPSSTMAELADEWASQRKTNIWGTIPDVMEMQSEGGAAGALHGALQAGSLATTFTASQGLMLMLPNMYKIAGELTACVIHVAARSLARNALSIFGDHQDVMAARTTGFALLASASVQEAHDHALVAQAATLRGRVPILHFFDGFRTSHEINKITLIPDAVIRDMIDDDLVRAHRLRALSPERPFVRGTAMNPDVYFQAQEASNPFYERMPDIVEAEMARLSAMTGRPLAPFTYHGPPDAERVIVIMGSGAETAMTTADYLNETTGAGVGVIKVSLFRPWSATKLLALLPPSTRAIAVLDRTKEAGAQAEPMYLNVLATLAEAQTYDRLPTKTMPRLIGGRYGLSSKEFTPGMVKAVYDELAKADPKPRFTVGITDDVTHLSLAVDPDFSIEPDGVVRAIFHGLGSDGTVGANKNSIKIIGGEPDRHAQAYFVYDSKKSGSRTVSHLRFGPEPITAPYLVERANFVACHQFQFVHMIDIVDRAAPGADVLLNSPYPPDETWSRLPDTMRRAIREKKLKLHVIDAVKVAREAGLGRRVNTIMQVCFFALSKVLPPHVAIERIKAAISKTYARQGDEVVSRNHAGVDMALAHLREVPLPPESADTIRVPSRAPVPDTAPDFVRTVTAAMLADKGDTLPVSALPADGTFPSGTTQYEKRDIATQIPRWDPTLCIQCGNCSMVCPHAVIRTKFYNQTRLVGAPESFPHAPVEARGFPDIRFSLQVMVADCTGCGLCVSVCPVQDPTNASHRAINMEDKLTVRGEVETNQAFFDTLPINDRSRVDYSTVKGAQFLRPLFEFSGACAGCGETPYVRLLSQLFGDRLQVANATGCSSIYGGNLPTTPWAVDETGRGPAWSNSLFEDNAEFGLGFRMSADNHVRLARDLLARLAPVVGKQLAAAILEADQRSESALVAQRARVETLRGILEGMEDGDARHLLSVVDHLVRRSIWIVGGDGWAYDIGSAGLDHVLSSGRDVNILVMDTEVYSNTGGQMSKATPVGAVAKFAAAGKRVGKKDLALQAISYGNVYVARVAMGANPQHVLTAFREAEAYPGTSIILAYSHCIAHGIAMDKGMDQQDLAVKSGYWPLLRYNPAVKEAEENPFILDSPRPRIALSAYTQNELRYRALSASDPETARVLMAQAQKQVLDKYHLYEEMAREGARGQM
ncbi:pyruvate:ferredoxin (flavodoxin) oxidoreductase [Rhodospira trueperi]|uniref:Pyruvate-flavodoxin oxidoreductase n=1 Tax=Rhodospira trueperi TaxID=69960 RepID=A0A1G6ZRH4_9PROT|nr:pyruvate:ferredoxin (flavodoxin) oxidoreductase [Rhodospira trueperi]SDE05384.1 pyruvate-ferredoxin/flavodoxin oxidoreductase [Rhodospira trueperi]